MKYDLKGAVIGVGRMGQRHLDAMSGLGLEIVGICDPRQDSLDAAGDQSAISKSRRYSDPMVLLKEVQPDCVVISTTADAHCELTCAAAEYGVSYILCEKPMACSIQECERMLDACRTTGARLAINHPMRFMPCYTEPKRILASEEFGGLTSMTVLGGNFGVAMNGTHFFEAFRYISDEEPDEVTAWFDELNVPNPRGPQFEDRAGSIRITSARGKRFYMECGASQGHGITAVYGGPYGQLMVDHLAGTMTSNIREAEHRNLPSTRYGMPSTRTNIKLDTADLVQLCSSVASALFEDAGYPTGEDGMLAIRTLVAAHVSHESGHVPVRVHSNVIPTDRPFPWA